MAFFGLNFGEAFVVVYITVAVISTPWWPRMGEWLADLLGGRTDDHEGTET